MYFSVLVAVAHLRDLGNVLAPLDRCTTVEPRRVYVEPSELEFASERGRTVDDIPAVLSDYLDERVQVEFVDDIPVYFYLTTENPEGRFHGWRIGGRFGRRFKANDPAHPDLIRPAPGEAMGFRREWVDGGVKDALDLEGTRRAWAVDAAARWDAFDEVRRRNPPALGWSTFFGRINAGTSGSFSFHRDTDAPDYTVEQARADYQAQPLIQEWKQSAGSGSCPVDQFGADRDAFLQDIRESAIGCHALVTLAGDWIEAQGEFSIDGRPTAGERAHRHLVNAYLDELPGDAWLVVVEVHD